MATLFGDSSTKEQTQTMPAKEPWHRQLAATSAAEKAPTTLPRNKNKGAYMANIYRKIPCSQPEFQKAMHIKSFFKANFPQVLYINK